MRLLSARAWLISIALTSLILIAIPRFTPRPLAASRPADIAFRIQRIDPGYSETAAVADLNNDGKPDKAIMVLLRGLTDLRT